MKDISEKPHLESYTRDDAVDVLYVAVQMLKLLSFAQPLNSGFPELLTRP
jgi:hypothetical protein